MKMNAEDPLSPSLMDLWVGLATVGALILVLLAAQWVWWEFYGKDRDR